jgi:hypothetical protein
MEHFLTLVCLTGLLFLSGDQNPKAQRMTATEAQNHIGDTGTVCGKVVGVTVSKYKVTSRGQPTFLDLDKPEPNPAFIIITWPEDAKPEQLGPTYLGKSVCVTGKIEKARGVPQIIATKTSQISIQSDEKK